MTDQVSSISSLASGSPATPAVIAIAAPAPGTDRSAKIADYVSQGQDSPAAVKSTDSPSKAVDVINSHLEQASTQLRLRVDAATGRTIYRVVDPATGQVVLQVPSAQVLAMAHTLQDMDKQTGTSGVLLDKQG